MHEALEAPVCTECMPGGRVFNCPSAGFAEFLVCFGGTAPRGSVRGRTEPPEAAVPPVRSWHRGRPDSCHQPKLRACAPGDVMSQYRPWGLTPLSPRHRLSPAAALLDLLLLVISSMTQTLLHAKLPGKAASPGVFGPCPGTCDG